MLANDSDHRTPFLLDFIGHSVHNSGELHIEDGETIWFYDAMEWTRLRSDVSGFIAPSAAPVDDDVTGFVPPVFENDALAVQVVWRFHERRPNEIIGLYHCRVESHDLHELRRAIEGTPWSLLPRPTGGEYRDQSLVLRYSRGDMLIERTFMLGCYEFIDAIRPVWERLLNVERKLLPLATLEIHARTARISDDPTRYTLHLALENRGTQPVVFTDPRIPFGDNRAFVVDNPRIVEDELKASLQTKSRLIVEVSSGSSEGFMKRTATYGPVPSLPTDAPRSVILRGGSKFELELPWVAPAPGAYWLRARWFDFDGPIEPVEGQLPFMPIPEQGPCFLGSGPYAIRGTVFTEGPFEVPA
jgi:hypothetical protein